MINSQTMRQIRSYTDEEFELYYNSTDSSLLYFKELGLIGVHSRYRLCIFDPYKNKRGISLKGILYINN